MNVGLPIAIAAGGFLVLYDVLVIALSISWLSIISTIGAIVAVGVAIELTISRFARRFDKRLSYFKPVVRVIRA